MKRRILSIASALMLTVLPSVHADTTLPLTYGDKAGFCVLAVFMGVLETIEERRPTDLLCEGDFPVRVDLNSDGEGFAALGNIRFEVSSVARGFRGDNWIVESTNPRRVDLGGAYVVSVTGRCTNDNYGFMITASTDTAIMPWWAPPDPRFVVPYASTFSQRLDDRDLRWPDGALRPAVVGVGTDVMSVVGGPPESFPRQFWQENLRYRRPNGSAGLITMRSERVVPDVRDCTLLLRNAVVDNLGGVGSFEISPDRGGIIRFR